MRGTEISPLQLDRDRDLVESLMGSRTYRDYERAFTRVTGLPLALQPLNYSSLAHHGKRNENRFCALLADIPETLGVCLRAHDELTRSVKEGAHSITCPFGLTETSIPVKAGGHTVAFLRVGQAMRHEGTAADAKRTAKQLRRCGQSFPPALRRAWEETPHLSYGRYDAIVGLLGFFARQLSELANEIMLREREGEPALVRKARAYITAHREERLTLAEVAEASGASVYYFCKVFKKATGLRFTDFVSRVRLEDARRELLKPERRVSEIAYQVGFQSLTQFNRAFKRVFGESPSKFRGNLQAARG